MMKVLKYNNGNSLEDVVKSLKDGNLVVYPTDTIYGIAADIRNEDAIKKVYQTKQRPFDKAISVCFHDIEQLEKYVYLDEEIKKVLMEVLPGPYTFLLKRKNTVNSLLTSNSPVIGVRIPDNEVAHILTEDFPITSTSANISDNPTPDNIDEIIGHLGMKIDTYIDYGVMKNNQPSTIVDLTQEKPLIVRQGLCDETALNKILKINL